MAEPFTATHASSTNGALRTDETLYRADGQRLDQDHTKRIGPPMAQSPPEGVFRGSGVVVQGKGYGGYHERENSSAHPEP